VIELVVELVLRQKIRQLQYAYVEFQRSSSLQLLRQTHTCSLAYICLLVK